MVAAISSKPRLFLGLTFSSMTASTRFTPAFSQSTRVLYPLMMPCARARSIIAATSAGDLFSIVAMSSIGSRALSSRSFKSCSIVVTPLSPARGRPAPIVIFKYSTTAARLHLVFWIDRLFALSPALFSKKCVQKSVNLLYWKGRTPPVASRRQGLLHNSLSHGFAVPAPSRREPWRNGEL